VKPSIAEQFYAAGQKLAAASGPGIADLLNQQLNSLIGHPFKAGPGSSLDSQGQRTATFGTLIRTIGQKDPAASSIEVAADATACVIDVSETLDLESFRAAYGRIAELKLLKKTLRAERRGGYETSATFGVIFAINSSVPLEKLAEELEKLNTKTPSHQWVDMVVILARGTIQYGVQFPGEGIAGDFHPPADGASGAPIPPIYLIVVVQPAGKYTFNKMGSSLVAHLTRFSPEAKLPMFKEVLEGTPNKVLTIGGFQYDLRGELRPVPRQFYQDRYLAPVPARVEDTGGQVLATLQFLPWQDGGVIIVKGKLPLEAILIFLGPGALRAGGVNRPGARITNVLPITWVHFIAMLQQLQQQSNFVIKHESPKMVMQKLADEGTSSPFIARLFLGILHFRDDVVTDEIKRIDFDAAYSSVITELQNARSTVRDLVKTLQDHLRKVATGEVARIHGNSVQIDENVDRQLSKLLDEFLNASVRAIKYGMQTLTKNLQVDIGFLFQKQGEFVKGLANLNQSDPLLAKYLEQARTWSDRLIESRNDIEHEGWKLAKIKYSVGVKAVTAEEPEICGQKVTAFATFTLDRLLCFAEEVTIHCLQRRMVTGISITEVALADRDPICCVRFRRTTVAGGTPVWHIQYHQKKFEET
jgi:hypothetical protein